MSLYTGLSPQEALAKWYAIRQKPAEQRTPEEQQDVLGNMSGLAAENPAAWHAVKTGMNDNGTTRNIFNPGTGQWDLQQDKGLFSHPETWIQLGLGGALGGVGATAALGGGTAGAAGGASGSAAGTTGSAAGGGSGLASFFTNPKNDLAIAQGVSDLGQVAGNDAAASAYGRNLQGSAQQTQDRNAIALYQAELNAAQQALNQRGQLAGQAAHGDLLSNVQDVQLSNLPASVQGRMPTLTGGLRPSVLGPNARSAGQQLSRQAILDLLNGGIKQPTAPTLTPLPQASGYEDFSKNLGRAGSYIGALGPLFGSLLYRPQPYQTVGPPLPPGQGDIFQD